MTAAIEQIKNIARALRVGMMTCTSGNRASAEIRPST